MKTLFLKSNILHIRTNEGEFEVSNPELIGAINIDWQSFILIHPYRTVNGNWFIEDNDEVEWPGGVELIDMLQIKVGNEWKNLLYQKEYKGNMESTRTIKLARLLPKEEKKHEWTTDEIMSMVEKKPAKPTESAYKEVDKPEPCAYEEEMSAPSVQLRKDD